MKKFVAPLLLIAAVATAACQPLSPQDRSNLGLVGGAAGGLLLADAFGANPQWTIVSAVAGAAIGTQVARNTQTGQCAYLAGYNSAGQEVYNVAPC